MRLIPAGASERSISPVIGTILLVAIVVVLAALVGTAALGFGEETDEPDPTLSIDSAFEATDEVDPHWRFTITHQSGDNIPPDELKIRLTDDRGGSATTVYPEEFTAEDEIRVELWGGPSRADESSCLVPPKAAPDAGNNQLDGNEDSAHATSVDIVVIHEPSNTLMDEVSVDFTEVDRGFTGDGRHYIADGSRASINCEDVPRSDF
jgi:flagellin-like protein